MGQHDSNLGLHAHGLVFEVSWHWGSFGLDVVGDVPADDLLDAASAAWSAWRYAHGTALALGDPADVDAVTGRRVAVWV